MAGANGDTTPGELSPGLGGNQAWYDDKLEQIIDGQKQMIQVINANFLRQSQNLTSLIEQKITAFRQEVEVKLLSMLTDIEDLRLKVTSVERRPQPSVQDTDLTLIYQRLGKLETDAREASPAQQTPTLIVKGLPEQANQSDDDLRSSCQGLLTQLEVTSRVLTATRVGAAGSEADTRRRRGPRLVSMSFASLDDVKAVMRNKRKLKDIADYSSVYIEPGRPSEIRFLENNIRRIVKELPNVEYRRGRVIANTPNGTG